MFDGDREFAAADTVCEFFRVSGDRFFAISGDKFLQSGEQRRLRKAISFNAIDESLGKSFANTAERCKPLIGSGGVFGQYGRVRVHHRAEHYPAAREIASKRFKEG